MQVGKILGNIFELDRGKRKLAAHRRLVHYESECSVQSSFSDSAGLFAFMERDVRSEERRAYTAPLNYSVDVEDCLFSYSILREGRSGDAKYDR
jgi:hypothetical protein